MPEHSPHEKANMFERLIDAVALNLRLMAREADLFLGAALVVLGALNWGSGKYCDGNTADYLSCTNPTTYYYYGGVEIALILVGVLLILVWYIKNRRGR